MKIFKEVKNLVKEEKKYTALILEKLLLIEKQKLYCDLKYPSLFKYLVKELRYTEAEANIRVAAVKLMKKDKRVSNKIAKGEINLTQAQTIVQNLGNASSDVIAKAVDMAKDKSCREFKDEIQKEFDIKTPRTERITLDERMLEKLDRVRKEYGDISNYELIDILLEEKLKTPKPLVRNRSSVAKVSRFIPLSVKNQVYTGKCANCGDRRNLEYDHITPHSKNGTNAVNNMQLLCRNCNQRKGAQVKTNMQTRFL